MFLSLFLKIVAVVGFSSVWLFILPSRVVVTGSGVDKAYDVIGLYCDEDYGVYFTRCTVKYYYEDNILTRIINATERAALWDDNTASGPSISAVTKSIVFEFEFVEEWYFKDIGIWFVNIDDTLIDSMYWQYKDINSGEIKNISSNYLGYSWDSDRILLGLYYEYPNTTLLQLARNNEVLTKYISITIVFKDDYIEGRLLTEIEIYGYNNDTYYLIPTGSTTPNPTPSPTDLINYTCIEHKDFIVSYTISLDNNDNTYSFSNDTRLFDYGLPINFENVNEMVINVTFDYNDGYYTNNWRFYGLKDVILNRLRATYDINMTTGAVDVTYYDRWFMETYFERYNENGLSLVVTNGTMTYYSLNYNITSNTYDTNGELSFFIDNDTTIEYARPKYFLIYYYGAGADSDDFGPFGEIDLRCFRNLYSTTTAPTTTTGTPTTTSGSTTGTSTSTTRTSLSSTSTSIFATEVNHSDGYVNINDISYVGELSFLPSGKIIELNNDDNITNIFINGFNKRVSMVGEKYSLFEIDFDYQNDENEDVRYKIHSLSMMANTIDGRINGNNTYINISEPAMDISLFLKSIDNNDGSILLSNKIEWNLLNVDVSINFNVSNYNSSNVNVIWTYGANFANLSNNSYFSSLFIDGFNVEIDWNGTIGINQGLNKFDISLEKIENNETTVSDSESESESESDSDGSTVNNICFPLSVFLCVFFWFLYVPFLV